MSKGAAPVIAALIMAALIALAAGCDFLIAWGALFVLHAFGVHSGFWPVLVAVLVLNAIFGANERAG